MRILDQTFIQISVIILSTCAGALAQSGGRGAQANTLKPDPNHVSVSQIQGDASDYLRVLGKRLTTPGYERATTSGSLITATGSSVHSFTWQHPGLVRFDASGSENKSLSFDGAASHGANSSVDQDLLETFTNDLPEAFFFSLHNGTAVRFLGGRFRSDDGKTSNYNGPWYGIYQLMSAVPGTQRVSPKLYYFDATSGLLGKVEYDSASPGTGRVTVQFSDWKAVGGEQFPGKIVRLIGKSTEFTITHATVIFGPAGDTSPFGKH